MYLFDLFFISEILFIVWEKNWLIGHFIWWSSDLTMNFDWRNFVSLACLSSWFYWVTITFIGISLLLWIIFNNVNIRSYPHLFPKNYIEAILLTIRSMILSLFLCLNHYWLGRNFFQRLIVVGSLPQSWSQIYIVRRL